MTVKGDDLVKRLKPFKPTPGKVFIVRILQGQLHATYDDELNVTGKFIAVDQLEADIEVIFSFAISTLNSINLIVCRFFLNKLQVDKLLWPTVLLPSNRRITNGPARKTMAAFTTTDLKTTRRKTRQNHSLTNNNDYDTYQCCRIDFD